jgi:hypothetical protein
MSTFGHPENASEGECLVQNGNAGSPVDNQTYNLLQILTSKLEAIEAYSVYEEDMSGKAAEVLSKIAEDERQHIDELISLLGISSS